MSEKPFGLAVRAVITDDQGRCLVIRRSKVCRHYVGKWEWPGGKADPGEAYDAAVRREVREETRLEIEPIGVVGAYGLEMEKVRVAVLVLEARLVGGTVKLSDEHDCYRWVPVADLPGEDLTDGLEPLAVHYAAAKADSAKENQ